MKTSSTKPDSLAVPWWVGMVQGIFSFVIGILLLTNPLASTLVIVQFIGIYWLVSGIFSLVGIFINKSIWGWKLLAGIVGIMAGLSVVQHPYWSTLLLPAVLVIFMGINGLVIGVVGLIAAFKGGGWAAGILGALSLMIGLLLLGSPIITGLALPCVYGILGVIGGISATIAAFQQRKNEEVL